MRLSFCRGIPIVATVLKQSLTNEKASAIAEAFSNTCTSKFVRLEELLDADVHAAVFFSGTVLELLEHALAVPLSSDLGSRDVLGEFCLNGFSTALRKFVVVSDRAEVAGVAFHEEGCRWPGRFQPWQMHH